jgi:hypothetical protein
LFPLHSEEVEGKEGTQKKKKKGQSMLAKERGTLVRCI